MKNNTFNERLEIILIEGVSMSDKVDRFKQLFLNLIDECLGNPIIGDIKINDTQTIESDKALGYNKALEKTKQRAKEILG